MAVALNIFDSIQERAKPADCALVQGDRQMSYGDLFARSEELALRLTAAFQELNHAGRLRIGVQFPSCLDYVPLALATLKAGFCFVPVPDELADAEKGDLAQRTALDGLIIAEDAASWLPENARRLDEFFINQSKVVVFRLEEESPSFPQRSFAELNPAFIRFSSGTTGRSKGVVLSHESLRQRIQAANEGLQIGPADRVLWVLPMAHHFAVSIILYLYHGATTVIEERHLGEDLLRAGGLHKATVMYGSPFHYRQLAQAPKAGDWPSLRLAVSTAAALNAETATKFRERFGRDLVQAFGIIEVGLPMMNFEGARVASEAIGKPLPPFECCLRNVDDLQVGELCLRGPGMFDAYLDPWQPRAEVVDADGWFATGDLAKRDADGRVSLCGRTKSVINVGGMKVFPEEVERVLDAHPGVKLSLVEPRSHVLFGEVPVARYVPRTGGVSPLDLRSYCSKHLASYKVPVTFTAVESLPMTVSGKLLRTRQLP